MREFLISYHKRKSFFHMLDPISKLVWAICLMVLSFTISNLYAQLALLLVLLLCVRLGTFIPFSRQSFFIRLYMVSSLFFFFLQVLLLKGDTVLFHLGPKPITWEAVNHAGNVAARMITIIGIALVFVDSTDPHDFGLALTQILKIDYRFTFMIFIVLQFLPLFEKEITDMKQAYQLRGYPGKPRFPERISMVKVFVSSLVFRGIRRSMILAMSMGSRGFRAFPERNYISRVRVSTQGKWFSPVVIILSILGIIFLN